MKSLFNLANGRGFKTLKTIAFHSHCHW